MGENIFKDLHVWRHLCLSIDFEKGTVKLGDNGQVSLKRQHDGIRQPGRTINHLGAGCFYESTGTTKYQSMYGRISDVQMFSRVLTDMELIEITGCKSRAEGDLLSWNSTNWIKSGPNLSIKKEVFDWEKVICRSQTTSLHIVPTPMNFDPESVDMCKKFSAQLAQYKTESEFHTLTQYLSQSNIIQSEQCWTQQKQEDNSFVIGTWLAIGDSQEEGVWTDMYTRTNVTYLPWVENRPLFDKNYNCMGMRMTMVDNGKEYGDIKSASIFDYKCKIFNLCPLCSLNQPVLKIYVRGLCPKSIFDRVYNYHIDKEGKIMYLGMMTSMIAYNSALKLWVWYDTKSNLSVATSTASYNSLLMGSYIIDFSGVVDDKCKEGTKESVRRVKFTTCKSGEFTCDNGHCITIEQKCDQTVDCDDFSDEEYCDIVDMNRGYTKTMVPFTYEEGTKR